MVHKSVSLEEAVTAVTAAHSAVWHAVAGYRYMWDAPDRDTPFELTIFGNIIATEPFPGLGIDWRYTVHPALLRERAQEVVKHTARQAIIDVSDAVRSYGLSSGQKARYSANSVVVLLRALRLAYAHRSDDWRFDRSPLPLQWRQIRLVEGMEGRSISELIMLSDQLRLLNDAIHLLDPGNPLTASVHR